MLAKKLDRMSLTAKTVILTQCWLQDVIGPQYLMNQSRDIACEDFIHLQCAAVA